MSNTNISHPHPHTRNTIPLPPSTLLLHKHHPPHTTATLITNNRLAPRPNTCWTVPISYHIMFRDTHVLTYWMQIWLLPWRPDSRWFLMEDYVYWDWLLDNMWIGGHFSWSLNLLCIVTLEIIMSQFDTVLNTGENSILRRSIINIIAGCLQKQ